MRLASVARRLSAARSYRINALAGVWPFCCEQGYGVNHRVHAASGRHHAGGLQCRGAGLGGRRGGLCYSPDRNNNNFHRLLRLAEMIANHVMLWR